MEVHHHPRFRWLLMASGCVRPQVIGRVETPSLEQPMAAVKFFLGELPLSFTPPRSPPPPSSLSSSHSLSLSPLPSLPLSP